MAVSKALQLLSCFYYKNVCSFIELCNVGEYSSDLGGYYIRQLIHDGYIEKVDREQYQILPKGKHFLVANQNSLATPPQARMSIALVVRQGDKFVVTERAAQPFIGRVEWPTGSVKFGESLKDAASRIALARLGVSTPLLFHGFFRRIDMYEQDIFDDKLFAVHVALLASDEKVIDHNRAGLNKLYTAAELRESQLPSRSLIDIFEYTLLDAGDYIERQYSLQAADLSIG